MKHSKQSHSMPVQGDELLGLEYEMASSSIGFEYALSALEEIKGEGFRVDELKDELECYKNSYFAAREQMATVDPSRLMQFEVELLNQKSVIFTKQNTLH
jgi:hypothetical protein